MKTSDEYLKPDEEFDGEILGEGSLAANYGKGLRADLSAFFRESAQARGILERLDNVERFVLLSYFLLKKTEKQLAELVGLNECRFNQFLENLVRKVGAVVVFGNVDQEEWAKVLLNEGLDEIKARIIIAKMRNKGDSFYVRALKEEKGVKTVDVLTMFLKSRSFMKVGEHFGVYYVDLRRGLEQVAEVLKVSKRLSVLSLGEFIGAQVQFAGVKEEGYAGRMGKLPELIRVSDPEVLGSEVVRIGTREIDQVLIPRALGAVQGGS